MVVFSCPEQLNRWPCPLVGPTQLTIKPLTTLPSDPRDLIRMMRRHLRHLRHLRHIRHLRHLLKQSCRLVTIETLITILTIENLNSWQSLLPNNQEWHWTAFAILAMLKCENNFRSKPISLWSPFPTFHLHISISTMDRCAPSPPPPHPPPPINTFTGHWTSSRTDGGGSQQWGGSEIW